LDDDALVAGLALEDEEAAKEFVRRFQAKVYGMAVAVTRERALADDVAQEAFVRAWRAASTYDGRRGSVATWLLTITRNAGIDAVRARRQVPADAEQLDTLLQAVLVDDTAEAATTRLEGRQATARLRELPPPQARAVALAVLGGCTAAEVSAREGVPLGTAKTRIRDGLRRLRALTPGATVVSKEDDDD
jgi:RNA polymerase sigma-70 factor (ECF subfamily)